MMKGHFSFLKTHREFSRIATDQVHEQNNKMIKGSGGATCLLKKSDESALIRWEASGPDISRVVTEFEDLLKSESSNSNSHSTLKKHHEDNSFFQKNFSNDVENLTKNRTCNPFEFTNLTMINNTSFLFTEEVMKQI